MRVFKDINLLKEFTLSNRIAGQTIGLVPTMGALHHGHMTLISNSLNRSGVTICSIYVNPTQFNNKSDLDNYPRPLDTDLEALEKSGCQSVFLPEDKDMYAMEPKTSINFGPLETVMEGIHRPGHFNGVALIVSKLFHLVQPDHAYFGQKDWQQVAIIKQMVSDLSFPIEIIDIPIVREEDGLAMSSRNRRLTDENRKFAPELHQALLIVKESLEQSQGFQNSLEAGVNHLNQFPKINIEYFEVVQSQTLQAPTLALGEESLSACIAAYLGEIRLIDNIKVF